MKEYHDVYSRKFNIVTVKWFFSRNRHGGLVFDSWWHRCVLLAPLRLLRSSRQPPLSEPPPLGSSFITLTWETQRDFFHPRALMFFLSPSRRVVLFTRYFVAAKLYPLLFFFPLASHVPFFMSAISRYSPSFYSLFIVFLSRFVLA